MDTHDIYFENSDPALLVLQARMQEAKQRLSKEAQVTHLIIKNHVVINSYTQIVAPLAIPGFGK